MIFKHWTTRLARRCKLACCVMFALAMVAPLHAQSDDAAGDDAQSETAASSSPGPVGPVYRFASADDLQAWQVESSKLAKVEVVENALRFTAPLAGDTTRVSRTLEPKLDDIREIRVRITLDQPAYMGWNVGLEGPSQKCYVAIHKDNMFAWIHVGVPAGQQGGSHYAGPRWHDGGEYEIRWVFDHAADNFHVEMVIDNGVPQTQGHLAKYTATIPPDWKTAAPLLTLGGKARQTGAVNVKHIRVILKGQEVSQDISVSETAQASFDKWLHLVEGNNTPALDDAIAQAKAATTTSPSSASQEKSFVVQAWDAHKFLSMFSQLDDAKLHDFAQRYTMLQFRNNLPDDALLQRIKAHEMDAALYMRTETPNVIAALEGSPHVMTTIIDKGKPKDRANIFSGDFLETSAIQTLGRIGPMMNRGVLLQVLIDSEIVTGVGDDPLSHLAMEHMGISPQTNWQMPGDKFELLVSPDDDTRKRLSLHVTHQSPWERHALISRVLRDVWPNLSVTTDPVYLTGELDQFRNLDVIQHWIRVHWAPRNPRSVAYYTKHMQKAVEANIGPKRIIIGPQLGRDTRATPPDMFSEACWLAVAFGAQGITHWGHQAIFTDDGQFTETGQALWQRMARLKAELYEPYSDLLMKWRPVKGRVAMLFSATDLQYDSGRRFHVGQQSAENMYRALLTLGEPVDILYEADVLESDKLDYEAVIVPQMYVGRSDVAQKLTAYAATGGKLIVHEDCPLSGAGIQTLAMDLAPVYLDYRLRKGEPSLTPQQYDQWLAELALRISSMLPFQPRVKMSTLNVIPSLMHDGQNAWLVLVNDKRTVGDEPQALGGVYMLDRGQSTTVSFKVDGAAGYDQAMPDGQFTPLPVNADDQATITLEPSWGAIIRLRS